MWQIPVFKEERDAGLENQVRSSASVAYCVQAQVAEPHEVTLSKRALADVSKKLKAVGHATQPDLFYLKSILVSVGWNKNEDVFTAAEAWNARHSPEDKPFNYSHEEDDIIGHITGNFVVDNEHKIVSDDTVVDDLPDAFHIVTSAVLYRFWEDEVLQERMDKVIAEIAENKWFVSMECLFKGFDYAVIAPDKSFKVIARNDKTAFLTKHLRAYGGTGKYENNRVGRLLRNITFSGKGLVSNPANEASIILGESETFSTAAVHICDSADVLGYRTSHATESPKQERLKMTDTEFQAKLDKSEAKVKTLKEQVETLTASLNEAQGEKSKAREEAYKNDIIARDGNIEKLKSELAAATEKLTASEANAVKLVAVQAELSAIKADQKKSSRLAVLKAAYKCTDEKATELLTKLEGLSDEAFKAHADYMEEAIKCYSVPAAAPVPTAGAPDAGPKPILSEIPKATNLPAPMGGAPKKVKTLASDAVHADPSILTNLEPNTDPTLNAVSTDDGVEKVRASIVEYMGHLFGIPEEEPVAQE